MILKRIKWIDEKRKYLCLSTSVHGCNHLGGVPHCSLFECLRSVLNQCACDWVGNGQSLKAHSTLVVVLMLIHFTCLPTLKRSNPQWRPITLSLFQTSHSARPVQQSPILLVQHSLRDTLHHSNLHACSLYTLLNAQHG